MPRSAHPPLFSIITVTFNAEETLPLTLASIHGQTGVEPWQFEHILVDGASTDATLEIAGRYKNRIRHLLSEPDEGIYHAMNKGLALATGTYVWFINAGDTIHGSGTLAKLVEIVEKGGGVAKGAEGAMDEPRTGEIAQANGSKKKPSATDAASKQAVNSSSTTRPVALPDILYGETVIIDANGNEVGPRRLKATRELTWRSFRHGMLVSHQAFIVKREIAPRYDLTYRLSSDVDWCIRCMKRAVNPIQNTYLVLVGYQEEGLTTRNRHASHKERFTIMAHHYGLVSTLLRHIGFALRFVLAKVWRGRTS